MKIPFGILFVAAAICFRVEAQINSSSATEISAPPVETIVCIRHGEKPKGGLGQLTCRGLNRALALPDVLLKKFGAPQFVFAPNPTQKVDSTNGYYYVRPLATIEPTAIRCGLPVNTEFGYKEIKGLENELQKPGYKSAVIFIAWEHGEVDKFVKNLVADNGGNPAQVPSWPGNDYDTIFLVKITHAENGNSVVFTIDHEDLNGLSDKCP